MNCFCYLHIFPNDKIYVGTTQQEKVELRWGSNGGGYKGDKHPMYGKHHTEDARRKMSESNKGKSRNKGVPKPKSKWLTPEGEIKEMTTNCVFHWHKDWTPIQNQ